MLKTAEADIKRGGTNQVLMVQDTSKIKKKSWSKKKSAKSKGDGMLDPSPSAASATGKPAKSPSTVCFYCKEDGHGMRNCTKYMADKAKSGSVTSNSGTGKA